jgi:hypothetical protein
VNSSARVHRTILLEHSTLKTAPSKGLLLCLLHMENLSKLEESALAKFDCGDFNGAICDLSKVSSASATRNF